MIGANKHIFNELASIARQSDRGDDSYTLDRHYIKTDENEKEWLQNLTVSSQQPISPRLITGKIKFKEEEFIAIIGWDPSHIKIENLEGILAQQQMNGGIFTALVYELHVPVKQHIEPLEIYNLAEEEANDRGLLGHEWIAIEKFFEPILLFRILETSPVPSSDLARLSCLFIINNPQNLILPFSNNTLETFERIITEGVDSLPFEDLLQCLNSFQWKYSFLDVYRCIEMLFSLPFLEELYKYSSVQVPFEIFSKNMEEYLNWRPNEEVAIQKLFENLPFQAKKLLTEVKASMPEAENTSLETWFYKKIRNPIVHHRNFLQSVRFEKDDWDKLLHATLIITDHLYRKYSGLLSPNH